MLAQENRTIPIKTSKSGDADFYFIHAKESKSLLLLVFRTKRHKSS